MKRWIDVGVAALVLLLVGGAIWFVLSDRETPKSEDTGALDPAQPDESQAPVAPTLRGTPKEAAKTPPDSGSGSSPPAPGTPAGAAPSTTPGSTDAAWFTGRVIDDKRKPVAGASVRVRGSDIVGQAASTDEDGRFRAGFPRPEDGAWMRVSVVARSEDGRVAVGLQSVSARAPDESSVGTLVLKPSHELCVRVTGDAGLKGPVTVDVFQGGMFGGPSLARAEVGLEEVAKIGRLPEGACRVVAWVKDYGRGVAATSLPRDDDTPLEIRLHEGRTVTFTVVKEDDGTPVQGAFLDLWEDIRGPGWMGQAQYAPSLDVPPTDAGGRTVLRALHHEAPLRVAVRHDTLAPGNPMSMMWRRHNPRLEPDDTELRIELPSLRTLAFPITDKDGPIPEDGTKLTLRPRRGAVQAPLPEGARIENGAVIVEGLPKKIPIHAEALTEDGRVARLFAMPDAEGEGRETSFVELTTVVVRLKRPDGKPVAGQHVVIRNRGNNALHDPVATDDTGVARIERLVGRQANVYLTSAGAGYGGQAVGGVDLSKGDVEMDIVVEYPRKAILKVFLDGEPGLPGEYSVGIPTHMGQTGIQAEEHLETGELHFDYTPTKGMEKQVLYFHAGGYVVDAKEMLTLTRGEGDGPDRAEVRLVSAASLTVRVKLPKDGHAQVMPQRWDDEAKTWRPAWTGMNQLDPEGKVVIKNLPAGRYRVVETTSGIASGTVELRAKEMARASIDASKVAQLRGRVEVPGGFDVKAVRVMVRGVVQGAQLGGTGQPQGAMVRADGTFYVRLPGDREVTLEPVHPTLAPAAQGGIARLTAARRDVVLRMVESATAMLRTSPPPPEPRAVPRRAVGFAVKLFAGADLSGEPVLETRAIRKDGALQFGGYQPGTYTLWFDIPGFAPLVIKDAQLGSDDADLGEHALSKGTTIRVRIRTKPGQEPGNFFISAFRTDKPAYSRYVNARAKDVIELAGLGAGTFNLVIGGAFGGTADAPKREAITVDGTGVIEREFGAP